MDEKFYIEILESNKDTVKRAVIEAMLDSIKRQFEWELPNELKLVVNKFIEEEVVPEVRAELMENKSAIVDHATEMVKGIPIEIGKALQEALAENLSNSWKLKKIVSAAFD